MNHRQFPCHGQNGTLGSRIYKSHGKVSKTARHESWSGGPPRLICRLTRDLRSGSSHLADERSSVDHGSSDVQTLRLVGRVLFQIMALGAKRCSWRRTLTDRIAAIACLHPYQTVDEESGRLSAFRYCSSAGTLYLPPFTLMFCVRSQIFSSVFSALSSSGCIIPALLNCEEV